MSRSAATVVCGSFLSLSSLCEWLYNEKRDVILFCAGWKHHVSFEDTFFAGAVVDKLKHDFHTELDSTFGTRQLYVNNHEHIVEVIKHSSHYRRLKGYGLERDIAFCIEKDKTNVIPILKAGKLVALTHS